MKSMKVKIAAAAMVLAAAIGSVSVYAHQSGHGGMGMMMGNHMGSMEGMEEMMTMMFSMSEEDRKAMHAACMKMMQSDGTGQSDHHDSDQ